MIDPSARFIGIDLGTSGCRAVALDARGEVHAEAHADLPRPRREGERSEQDPAHWWRAVHAVLAQLAARIDAAAVTALAVDGTSGALLLADENGDPLGPALMYDDARSRAEATLIAGVAPSGSAAHGTGSALAKLLHLRRNGAAGGARHALHQADWIAARLSGRCGVSDENNCLKLGYDAVARRWPDWLARLDVDTGWLPTVARPGEEIGRLRNEAILRLGYPPTLAIRAGTTDSVAAFIATGARNPGDAVTSLGSTIVLKVLCTLPVSAPEYGVYSHPFGGLWLAGGGSNSGGAVLLDHFTPAAMAAMTPQLQPDRATGLDYYPLRAPGERFPRNDPDLPPRLTPRPDSDLRFFQGMLEGMAHIEAEGYRCLATLGAPWPERLMTVGGGARNPAWTLIRERALGLRCVAPRSDQACYGSAMIALHGAPVPAAPGDG
jgi:sugar (pentulose or hexulose) kinase